jgi:hypothetical protein
MASGSRARAMLVARLPSANRAPLHRVIHLEFDRVRGVLERVHFLPLQFHVRLDLVHAEEAHPVS